MKQPMVKDGMTFEMAKAGVQGTKFKALKKFSPNATPEFDYDDMIQIIDLAIYQSWENWDPEKTKFNTHVTNMLNWKLIRALEQYNYTFKISHLVKNNMTVKGETVTALNKRKVTLDTEFNEYHGLDGENPFTKEHYNLYVKHLMVKNYGVTHIKRQSEFGSPKEDEFDIFDTIEDETIEDSFMHQEFVHDAQYLDNRKKKIYDMISDGKTVGEVAKELKMSKKDLMEEFGATS